MKNALINNSKPGKYYCWAHSAPIDALTRKDASLPPRIIGTLHMLRDSTACLHLADLVNRRYNYGGILYNLPPDIYKRQKPKVSQLSHLSRNDLILLTTRPPLNDRQGYHKRWIFQSGSDLENIILQNMKMFFVHCDRRHIILSNKIASKFKSRDDSSYRAIIFDIYIDAYIAYKANVDNLGYLENPINKVSNSKATIGFIVYIPQLIKKNAKKIDTPGVLSVFSLNGTMTLVWSYFVWAKYSNLINEIISSKKPRIILAKFKPEISNDIIPTDLSFVDSMECEIKIDVIL